MTTPPPADALPENAHVLLVRLSALGDIIFALETLASLKHERPDVRIDFLIEDRFAAVLRDHPLIDNLVIAPRKRFSQVPAHVRRLRRTRYDVVLDLHGILKSSIQVWWIPARLKLGYASPGSREGAAFAYHRKVVLPSPLPHRAERGNFLLRELGLRGEHRPAELPGPADVPDFFADHQGHRVILHPGTSAFAAFKRWPLDKFVALAQRLVHQRYAVAMSYGPGETALFERVQAEVPELIGIDGTQLGLTGLGQAMRQAEVLVAADTGPLHIAAGVGTRVVALFGPKDSNLYGPRGDGHRVLFHDVPCRPCKRRTCASPQCVLGIEVAAVESCIAELVGQ